MRSTRICMTAAAALLAFAPAARAEQAKMEMTAPPLILAQAHDQGESEDMMSADPAAGMMSFMGWGGMAVGMVDSHLAFLATALKLTDAQKPLWDAYAKAIRANAEAMRSTHHGRHMGGGGGDSVVDRLNWYEKHLSARLDMLRSAKAALEPLHASFSPEQKQIADRLLVGHMEHM